MILAVVGSTSFEHPDALSLARQLILHKMEVFEPELIVSGGAEGIDKLAAFCADGMGIDCREFFPTFPRWEPEGYKARNILVASACTDLFAIRCHRSRTYGSGWTADFADSIGKKVERITL